MARNTRQQGGRYENAVAEMAEALGYCAFPARGSRGPVDVICFESDGNDACGCPDCGNRHGFMLPPLVVQVGTAKKPIAATLAELESAPRPIGSLCLVARRHRKPGVLKDGRKGKALRIVWSWHSAAGTFGSLKEALDGGRAER
jgi:hypothetical protein